MSDLSGCAVCTHPSNQDRWLVPPCLQPVQAQELLTLHTATSLPLRACVTKEVPCLGPVSSQKNCSWKLSSSSACVSNITSRAQDPGLGL
jgi:hypothetical protein